MTCVLPSATSPWQPFSAAPHSWSPMNPAPGSSTPSYVDRTQYGYASSDTESRKTSGGSSKKRASRAGTRSVSTLSAAQLERKRANDREAQRAIRQRTKDHIDSLERTVSELRHSNEANENMVVMTQRRNRELEEENGYLRSKLGEPGYHLNVHPPEHARPAEQQMLSAHSTSPATSSAPMGAAPSDSDPSSRNLSLATSHSSASSRAGSWQQGHANYAAPTSQPPPSVGMAGSVNLTTWRSHDSTASVHSTPTSLQHPGMQGQPQTPYATSNPSERTWTAPQAQTYGYQDQSRAQQSFDAQSQQQSQQQYAQPGAVQSYSTSPVPSQPHAAYGQAAPAPPQAEFQGMQVSSPAGYQVSAQQSFGQPAQYQMAPQMQPTSSNTTDYTQAAQQQGHMQPPPVPQTAYQTGAQDGTQQYAGAPQFHPPMQFRDDASRNNYSLTHYPSG